MITPQLVALVEKQLSGQFSKEVIENYPYFDKENVGNASATLTTPDIRQFFVNSKDTAANGSFDTNWTGQRQTVDGQSLLRIKGFAFGFQPNVAVADIKGVLLNGMAEFRVGEKTYMRITLEDLGSHGGLYGFDFTAGANASVLTNGVPHSSNYHRIGSDQNPIVLNPQQKFELLTRTEYTTATRCRMVMIVDEFRTS